jgi:hypothetical protein
VDLQIAAQERELEIDTRALQRRERRAHILVFQRDHEVEISGEPRRTVEHDVDSSNDDVANVCGL